MQLCGIHAVGRRKSMLLNLVWPILEKRSMRRCIDARGDWSGDDGETAVVTRRK